MTEATDGGTDGGAPLPGDPLEDDQRGGLADAGPDVPCRNHEDRRAATLCERCGDFLCGLCTIRLDAVSYCPLCVVKVRADVMQVGAYVPWEDRSRLGVTRAAWETVRASFTRPKEFMERLPLEGGITDPLLFGMLIRGVVVVFWGALAAGFYLIMAAATQDAMMLFQAGVQLGSIFFNILYAAALLLIGGFILHLAVMVFAGTRGYEATFRIFSYGHAVDVLELIPIVGWFASVGMRIYLHYLGLQPGQGLSPPKALFTAALPLILLIFFVVFLVGIFLVIMLMLI